MYIVVHNNGWIRETTDRIEAQFWAFLSLHFSVCNVYRRGGSGVPLGHMDFY